MVREGGDFWITGAPSQKVVASRFDLSCPHYPLLQAGSSSVFFLSCWTFVFLTAEAKFELSSLNTLVCFFP